MGHANLFRGESGADCRVPQTRRNQALRQVSNPLASSLNLSFDAEELEKA